MKNIAVSACLVGKNTKYDGTNNYNQAVIDYLKDKEYILICPEVQGGLPTPRIPSEIVKGKVINKEKNPPFWRIFKFGTPLSVTA